MITTVAISAMIVNDISINATTKTKMMIITMMIVMTATTANTILNTSVIKVTNLQQRYQ